jgi:hypothetical protein
MKRLAFAPLALVVAACGPSLAELLPAHHYREAVCLANQGSDADRATVLRSLETTGNVLVHVAIVPPFPDYPSGTRFARVTLQSDRLPLDGLGIDVAHGLRYADLLALTKEPPPPKRRVSTRLTTHNVGVGLALLFTGGLWLLTNPRFNREIVEVEPDEADYMTKTPRAYALRQSMPDAGECGEWLSGYAEGSHAYVSFRCERYVIVPADGTIDLGVHFEAFKRSDEAPTRDDVCHVQRVAHLALGPDVEARTKTIFGAGMRRLRDVAAP